MHRDNSTYARRKSDQAFSVLAQKLEVNSWLVVEAFSVTQRHELDKIPIAREILGEQDDVVMNARPLPIRFALRESYSVEASPSGDNIGLSTDDGFDTRSLRLPVEFDRARHYAVIGEREGWHLILNSGVNQGINAACAVEKAIMRMVVKMYKLWHDNRSVKRGYKAKYR
jgi:hypothetical protein